MWKAKADVLLILCIVSLGSTSTGCDPDGPGNCTFGGTGHSALCGWSLGGNAAVDTTGGGFIQLAPEADTGNLISREACGTQGQTNCLRFSYRVYAADTFRLSVSIKFNRPGNGESLLWVVSSSLGWSEGAVPIAANHSFRIIFRAERILRQNSSEFLVALDNTRYSKHSSLCHFHPPDASPTLPHTTNSATDVISTSDTSPSTTRIRTSSVWYPHSEPSEYTGQLISTPHHGTDSLATALTEKDTTDSSHTTAVIVGSALASVAIVVAVILILVVLVRTKRLQLGKLCFHDTQQEPQDNDGYEVPLPRGHNNQDMARTAEQGNTREATPRTDRVSTQTEGQTPRFVNNYDSLDFTSTEQDKRVYTSLYDGPAPLTASGQPGLYQALGQRRDSHVYCQAQGSRQDTDNMNSAVYYNVVER